MQYCLEANEHDMAKCLVLQDLLLQTGISHRSQEEYVKLSPMVCKEISTQQNNVNTSLKTKFVGKSNTVICVVQRNIEQQLTTIWNVYIQY